MLGAAAWIPFSIFVSGYATYVYHEGHWGIPVLDLAAFVIGQQFTLMIAVFPLVTCFFQMAACRPRGGGGHWAGT